MLDSQYKKSQYFIDIKLSNFETLFFSTKTNTILIVDNDVAERFLSSVWTISERERWLYGGFLVENHLDERSEIYQKFKNAKENKNLSLIICPTLGCNLRCGYCYEGSQSEIEFMKDSVADDIIEFVRKGSYENIALTWYGGEPLLAVDRILDLQRKIGSIAKIASSSIITNGVLLTPEVFSKLTKVGIDRFQITLDGSEQYHDSRRVTHSMGGTFAKIVSNLRNINCSLHYLSLRVNVDKSNAESFLDLMDFFSKDEVLRKYIGVLYPARVTAWPTLPKKWKDLCLNNDEFNEYYFELADKVYALYGLNLIKLPETKNMYCGASADNSYVVGPSGELYKCWISVGNPKATVGNIANQNIDINPSEKKFWNEWDISKIETCSKCKFLPLCMGGCAGLIHIADMSNGGQCIQIKSNVDNVIRRAFRNEIDEHQKS